jgi:protein SCO1/2
MCANLAHAQTANPKIPVALQNAGITERLGETVALDRFQFRDERNQPVTLKTFSDGKKPLVIALMYMGCPSLCGYLVQGTLELLNQLKWTPGKEFELVFVSIDPREKPDLAETKKASFFEEYKGNKDAATNGIHFLTGEENQIRPLAEQLGFRYYFDTRQKEYAHGAGLFVLMPEGKISRVLHGIQFRPTDFKLAVLEASAGKIGSMVERILMLCYRYDPLSRSYSLVAMRLVQAGSVLMLLVMLAFGMTFWLKKGESRP